MLSGLNYAQFRFTQGVHMGMAWETIINTPHPNPNVIISQPYWLHHSKKAHSLVWGVIVPWYPSKHYWLIFIFFSFVTSIGEMLGQYLSPFSEAELRQTEDTDAYKYKIDCT